MNSKKNRIYWVLSGLWVALIYSTLSIVRGVSNYLSEIIPLSFSLSLGIGFILLGVIVFFFRRVSFNWFKVVLLISLLCGYGYGLATIKYPDEKIHFIQYGVLSVLLLKALKSDYRCIVAYIGAFILCSLAGYGDELLQGQIPNRYYDTNDIILNSVSGAMGLGLAVLFETSFRR